ncbi:MAG: ketopantoate reductase family protein [Gammaproteobacteria bacterium]|nr:ketopantoate reductase family protein [Gammaproteobacteria bacterium]
MRFVIYGAGGIGGTIGARLHLGGIEVGLIARGAHYEAIVRDGLRFVSPSLDVQLRIPCFPRPDDADIRPDDAVILCMKGQHTEDALRDLYAATGGDARVVCCQNGVENERLALRRFPHTYGMVVMLPAEHLEPGVVVNFAEGTAGGLDAGCYPSGVDDFIESVTAALCRAGFSSAPDGAIMGQKYAKLLGNLNNAVQAATGTGSRAVAAKLREEALACYRAAGIHCATAEETRARRADIRGGEVPGHKRHGGSSLQSMLRGTGDIETDFMNGEIVLLGRLHGVPVPANTLVQEIGNRLVRENLEPGSVTIEELESVVLGPSIQTTVGGTRS